MDIFALLARGKPRPALRLLDAVPATLRKTTPKGSTVLMAAVHHGVAPVVSALLARGVDVNQRRRDGFTALQLAAQGGDAALVAQLLAAGATDAAQALACAQRNEHRACIRLLVAATGGPSLLDVIPREPLAMIRRVLKNPATRLVPRALTAAIEAGRPDVVAALLEAGARSTRAVAAFQRAYRGIESVSVREAKALLKQRRVPTRHLALGDDRDRVLVYRGDTRLRSLRLDHGELVGGRGPAIGAGLIIDGDLTVTGTLHNGEQDFGPFLVVLGDLDVKHAALGGATVHIAGKLTVRGAFHGYYNHGHTTVAGDLDAALVLPDDYALELGGRVRGAVIAQLGHVRSKHKLPAAPPLREVVAKRYLAAGDTGLRSHDVYEALVAGKRLR